MRIRTPQKLPLGPGMFILVLAAVCSAAGCRRAEVQSRAIYKRKPWWQFWGE